MCKDTRDYRETTSRARRMRTGGNGITPDNLFDSTNPTTIEPDDAASPGTATTAARIDHTHAITAGNPDTIEPDDTTWEGNNTTFARSDEPFNAMTVLPKGQLLRLPVVTISTLSLAPFLEPFNAMTVLPKGQLLRLPVVTISTLSLAPFLGAFNAMTVLPKG
jgi:hypothetical protein